MIKKRYISVRQYGGLMSNAGLIFKPTKDFTGEFFKGRVPVAPEPPEEDHSAMKLSDVDTKYIDDKTFAPLAVYYNDKLKKGYDNLYTSINNGTSTPADNFKYKSELEKKYADYSNSVVSFAAAVKEKREDEGLKDEKLIYNGEFIIRDPSGVMIARKATDLKPTENPLTYSQVYDIMNGAGGPTGATITEGIMTYLLAAYKEVPLSNAGVVEVLHDINADLGKKSVSFSNMEGSAQTMTVGGATYDVSDFNISSNPDGYDISYSANGLLDDGTKSVVGDGGLKNFLLKMGGESVAKSIERTAQVNAQAAFADKKDKISSESEGLAKLLLNNAEGSGAEFINKINKLFDLSIDSASSIDKVKDQYKAALAQLSDEDKAKLPTKFFEKYLFNVLVSKEYRELQSEVLSRVVNSDFSYGKGEGTKENKGNGQYGNVAVEQYYIMPTTADDLTDVVSGKKNASGKRIKVNKVYFQRENDVKEFVGKAKLKDDVYTIENGQAKLLDKGTSPLQSYKGAPIDVYLSTQFGDENVSKLLSPIGVISDDLLQYFDDDEADKFNFLLNYAELDAKPGGVRKVTPNDYNPIVGFDFVKKTGGLDRGKIAERLRAKGVVDQVKIDEMIDRMEVAFKGNIKLTLPAVTKQQVTDAVREINTPNQKYLVTSHFSTNVTGSDLASDKRHTDEVLAKIENMKDMQVLSYFGRDPDVATYNNKSTTEAERKSIIIALKSRLARRNLDYYVHQAHSSRFLSSLYTATSGVLQTNTTELK